jgi:hypothetical protein
LHFEVGDRVSVSGDIDARFFGGPELQADGIVVLKDASRGDRPSTAGSAEQAGSS